MCVRILGNVVINFRWIQIIMVNIYDKIATDTTSKSFWISGSEELRKKKEINRKNMFTEKVYYRNFS